MSEEFGEKMRALRRKRGMTLDELAQFVGSKKAYIWQLENKKPARPSGKLLLKIADALETTPDFLIDDSADEPTDELIADAFYRKVRSIAKSDHEKIGRLLEKLKDEISIAPIKQANNITRLWQSAGPGTYPIDIQMLIDEGLNKRTDEARLLTKKEDLSSIEGMLCKLDNSSWVAVINERISHEGRKLFTLAHELGHFICHRKLHDEFSCGLRDLEAFTSIAEHDLETQANQFASQLLLPPNELRRIAKDRTFSVELTSDVADAFGVSLSAAALKLVEISSKDIAVVVSRDDFVLWGRASKPAYQKGIFFRSASEVPEGSITTKASASLESIRKAELSENKWIKNSVYRESCMISERYHLVITCLEFVSINNQ